MAESPLIVFIACLLCILGTGMYYTIIGTSFAFNTTGTLTEASVYHASGKDSDSYYVVEKFSYTHDGDDSTCTVLRPTYYITYGSASDAAGNKKLGTTRTVWIASYSDHTCSDSKLKTYNMAIGVSLLSILGFILLIPVMIVSYGHLKNGFGELCCCFGSRGTNNGLSIGANSANIRSPFYENNNM